MSSSILRRVSELERRMDSLMNPPQPVKVFFAEQTEEIAAYQQQHPGAKLVIFTTVCARRCDDSCPHPGGPGCRKGMDEPARSWQPREGSCD